MLKECGNSTRRTVRFLIYKHVHDVHWNIKVAVIAQRIADYGFFPARLKNMHTSMEHQIRILKFDKKKKVIKFIYPTPPTLFNITTHNNWQGTH